MINVIERYNLSIRKLSYNLSNYMRKYQHSYCDCNRVNEEMIPLLKTEVLKLNFFAIDKDGRYMRMTHFQRL